LSNDGRPHRFLISAPDSRSKKDRYGHKKDIGVDGQVLGIFPHWTTGSSASDGLGFAPALAGSNPAAGSFL